MICFCLGHLPTSLSPLLTEHLASESPQHLCPAGFGAEVGEGSPGAGAAYTCAVPHPHPKGFWGSPVGFTVLRISSHLNIL